MISRISAAYKIVRITATLIIVASVTLLIAGCLSQQAEQPSFDKQVLVIVPHGFGVNYYQIQDVIDQYGWHVTYAGLTDSVEVCEPFAAPRGGISMKVDTLTTQIDDVKAYDAVLILTSTQFSDSDPYADIMGSPHTMNLIATAAKENIPVMASCAGVRLLAALDLINGKRISGSPKYQAEYEAAGAIYIGKDVAPQIVGNLITSSRGQYNNLPSAIALATVMERHAPTESAVRSAALTDFMHTAEADFGGAKAIWTRTYGGSSADGARAICETPDGGLLVVGYTYSQGTGDANLLAMKIDHYGNIIWSRNYGGTATEYGYACAPTEDGFVVTGYTSSPCPELTDEQIYLMKMDFDGNSLWIRTYGGSGCDIGASVCTVPDGYVICGSTESNSAGEADICLIKTDTEGNELWIRTFGGEFSDIGNSVAATGDGGLIIGATTNSFGGGNSDFYLIRTDAEGNQIWAEAHHPTGREGHGFDWGNAMCIASDGGYFISGHSDCNDLMDAFVIKTDSRGKKVWEKAFGQKFYDYGNAVYPAVDGGVYVCGATKEPFNNNDIFLTRLDADGNIVSETRMGGEKAEWASDICVSGEGNCFVVGHTSSCGSGSFDILITRVEGI